MNKRFATSYRVVNCRVVAMCVIVWLLQLAVYCSAAEGNDSWADAIAAMNRINAEVRTAEAGKIRTVSGRSVNLAEVAWDSAFIVPVETDVRSGAVRVVFEENNGKAAVGGIANNDVNRIRPISNTAFVSDTISSPNRAATGPPIDAKRESADDVSEASAEIDDDVAVIARLKAVEKD